MNLVLVQTFLTAVAEANLSRAAHRLHVTQSTVTARLDTLEEQLGQELIVRSKGGAQLTAAGFRFLRHAEMLIQIWHQARYEIGLPKGFEGVFNLACQSDLWTGAGETWLQHMRCECPSVALSVWSGSLQEISGWLDNGMIDAALAFDVQSHPNCRIEQLFEDRLLQVSSEPRERVRWDTDYVYVDLGPDFRRRHAEEYPVDETAPVTFGRSKWALDHILTVGGSAYLPWRIVREHVEGGGLFSVPHTPMFRRPVYIIHNELRTREWPWFQPFIGQLRKKLSLLQDDPGTGCGPIRA